MSLKASVIIAAYNDEDLIEKAVQDQLDQDYKNKEIIVHDNASTDMTPEILKKFGRRIIYIRRTKDAGFGGAINAGVQKAKGDVVVIVQSDFVPEGRHWLAQLLEPFKDEKVGVVMSQQIVDHKQLGFGEKLFEVIAPQELLNTQGRLVEQQYTRLKAAAVRKKIFHEFGRFNTKASGDDVYFSLKVRQKHKILLSDKAKALSLFSNRQRSVKSVFKKAIQYGWPAYRLYKQFGYDGMHTRAFLLSLAIFLSAPLLLLSQVSLYGYAALFALSFLVRIKFSKLGFGLPFAVLPAVLSVPVWVMGYGQTLELSLILSSLAFCAYYGLMSCRRHLKKGYNALHLPFVFLFVILWRLLSGVGYAKGFMDSFKKERVKTW